MEVIKVWMATFLLTTQTMSSPFPFKTFFSDPTMDSFLLPRIGRNSKVMLHDSTPEVQEEEFTTATSVEDLLKDLEAKLAEVSAYSQDDSEDDFIVNDLADQMIAEALEGEQKDREFRAKEGTFDIEHTFNLHEDEQVRGSQLLQQPQPQQPLPQALSQPLPQQQYQPQSQPLPQGPSQPLPQFQPRSQPQSQFQPRQAPQINPLDQNQFGDNMGAQLEAENIANIRGNVGGRQNDVDPLVQDEGVEGTEITPTEEKEQPKEEGNIEIGGGEDEDVRCINKVMQVTSTVYEDKIKCQHTFTEKCHDTFITDYVPTQEKKCETSFDKNCHITYKPMMFEETVKICDEPLKKICNNDTVGKGDEVCKTHYETTCETRYKEHEVEQDEPVCVMVTERKCNDVRVPVPDSDQTRGLLRRTKRRAQQELGLTSGLNLEPAGLGGIGESLQSLDSNTDLLSVGEECEDWPVQKCTLEKKTVKKTNPETSCRKMPREICAPGNCAVRKSDKVCREELKQFLQNIPSEVCDLEPREDCKMETVLVPRLVQQPNCVKVPKEVCINAKTNPKKVKKPVVKEWCYKPSDLKSPSTRLALSQFFSN